MYDKKYMDLAMREAKKALKKDEVPIGAVIVKDNKVIAKGYNMKELKKSSLFHAEIIAINKATKIINNWRLDGCDIYINLEPCPMCASLIHQSRIDNIYYCVKKSNTENISIINSILVDNFANKKTNIYYVDYNCKENDLINKFFDNKR